MNVNVSFSHHQLVKLFTMCRIKMFCWMDLQHKPKPKSIYFCSFCNLFFRCCDNLALKLVKWLTAGYSCCFLSVSCLVPPFFKFFFSHGSADQMSGRQPPPSLSPLYSPSKCMLPASTSSAPLALG